MLQNRKIELHEIIDSYDAKSQKEDKTSDITINKIKEIIDICHLETDKKLEELINKCVKNNEQQKA